MIRIASVCAFLVTTAVASADLIEANILSVDSSNNLSGPPSWPITYQPVADYSSLCDGSVATGIEIVGGEHVTNPNGSCDSGGALRVLFQTSVEASELHLDIWLRSYAAPGFWPGPYTGMTLYDATDYHALHWVWPGAGFPGHDGPNDGTPLHFSGTFNSSGNTFNDDPSVTIDDVRLPGNRFLVTLWGPYMASVHDAGPQGLIVYEAHAWYAPVPEPASLSMLALGVLASLRRQHGHRPA